MSSLKAIKRKAQAPGRYREALIALGYLHERLDRLHLERGDLVLFKLGDHSQVTTEMIQAFMEIMENRGITGVDCFLCKRDDAIETISHEAFDQLARMRGYVKEGENAVSQQSAAEGDGDRGASPGEAESGEPRPTADVEAAAPRICEHSREGIAEAEGLRPEGSEGERFLSDEEIESMLERAGL